MVEKDLQPSRRASTLAMWGSTLIPGNFVNCESFNQIGSKNTGQCSYLHKMGSFFSVAGLRFSEIYDNDFLVQ